MRKYTLAVIAAGAAVALAPHNVRAGDIVLAGQTILVGMNNGGSIVENTTAGPTPTSPFIGIQYDSTGTGNYSKGYDFITPGDPYQYFSVGYGSTFVANSFDHGNPMGFTTANTSSGGTLQSTSTGGSYGPLSLTQTMSFQNSGAGSGIMAYTVTIKNTSTDTAPNVAYATGLDPDQDVYFDGNYATANYITSKNFLYATGTATAWTIAIANTSAYTPTGTWIADEGWDFGDLSDENPYITTFGTASGSFVGVGNNYADDTLNMDWQLGDLAAGATVTLTYDYVIAANPSSAGAPDGASTVGLLGLALAGLGAVRRKIRL